MSFSGSSAGHFPLAEYRLGGGGRRRRVSIHRAALLTKNVYDVSRLCRACLIRTSALCVNVNMAGYDAKSHSQWRQCGFPPLLKK